jgi:ATP-binding cassette subfamily F protein 3
MSLLTAYNLAKFFGPEEIFSTVTVEIPHGARIALVGPNGAGKTTLLNILIGNEGVDEGTVTMARNTRIGYLPQRPTLSGQNSLWEEALSAFAEVRAMEAELNRIEHALADNNADETMLTAYGELQERFEAAGGYLYEHRIRTVLHGLGFSPDDYSKPLVKLSGGQTTRALLARLLLEAPDLLALDEPTNHLDITAVEWLEGYLKDFPGAVLVVSHDRYFLDAVAKTVWELDFGSVEVYRGNYSHYTQQREERHERLLKEFESQQDFIAKEEDYIRRNMAGQNTKQAQGRRTRLNRLKRDGLVRRPRQRQNMNLRLNSSGRSGDRVLKTTNLVVGYADAPAPLFQAPDITLQRGEVAALIGPNGAGKSTFLKTVLGQLPPLGGETQLGASLQIGYFAQAHELLDASNSVLDEIMSVKELTPAEARNFLGMFMFQGDDVFRPISTLSGGERGRVALAKLALAGANFLMLDEPTNHLDIESQEILQNVLADFGGTILLVSHDRYLIDALATQVWSLTPGELTVYKGNYQEFVAWREARKNAATAETPAAKDTRRAAAPEKPSTRKHGLTPFHLARKLEALEAEIHALETELDSLTAAIGDASAEGDSDRVRALGERYTQAEAELTERMETWATLAE